jgi:hypothetical protein
MQPTSSPLVAGPSPRGSKKEAKREGYNFSWEQVLVKGTNSLLFLKKTEMRQLALALVSILVLWSTVAVAQQKKLVFIILDGIPAQDLERVATPNLDQVIQKGGYARASSGGQKGG